ncbi:MAG: hypothetical protein Q9200_005182 [Gallowayella weberi]
MLLLSSCICAYLSLLFATLVASLSIRPQAGPPNRSIDVNLTGAELAFGGAGAGKTSWCRPPNSNLDLFSITGGHALPFPQVLYAVSYFREVLGILVKEQGKEAKCDTRSTKVTTKGIVVTVLDELLQQRTWNELLDALDVLLVCCFTEKVHAEVQGTFFQIKTKFRLASVSIAKERKPRRVESVGES